MKPEQARAVGLAMVLAASSLVASTKSPLADAAEHEKEQPVPLNFG